LEHHWTDKQLADFGVSSPLYQHEFIEINGEVKVDFIGRFENFEYDFAKICNIIGVKAELPHLLQSKHDGWARYFNRGLAEYAETLFQEDFELWESRSLA